MKSTVKIGYEAIGSMGMPVIKIVQPIEVLNPKPQDDVDPRDVMVSQFIHPTVSKFPSELFVRKTYYPHPFENPTHYITNIEAVPTQDKIYALEQLLTNTIIEWKVPFDMNEVAQFFEKINKAVRDNRSDDEIPVPQD